MQTSFPKSRIRVLLLEGVHGRAREAFEREGFQIEEVRGALDRDGLAERIGEVHVLGIRSKSQIDGGLLSAARRLLTVGCFCIGTNQVDVRAGRARGVPVFNSPFSNTRSVAELTIAEIVALHRRLFDRSKALHAGEWRKSAAGAHEVRGRTLGIVGYGHIGSQVSVLAEAMGMQVVFYDIMPKLALGNARPVGSLDELLERSDVVTLHVPATPATRELMDESRIGRMRPGGMLINNARGSVVDLGALGRALEAGRLGGAALDVFPEEPASSGERFACELQGLENVILTPHIGGSTEEAQEAIATDVASKLIRFVNVGSTTGAVNVPEVDLPEQPHPDSMEADERRPHRILHFHRNVPGVLSKMHQLIASAGGNITGEYLRTHEDVGYVVLDVDPTDTDPIVEGLRGIPETIRVRVLW